MGLTDAQLRQLLLKFPRIVEYSTDLLKAHLDLLRSIGLVEPNLAKV